MSSLTCYRIFENMSPGDSSGTCGGMRPGRSVRGTWLVHATTWRQGCVFGAHVVTYGSVTCHVSHFDREPGHHLAFAEHVTLAVRCLAPLPRIVLVCCLLCMVRADTCGPFTCIGGVTCCRCTWRLLLFSEMAWFSGFSYTMWRQ